MKLFVVLIITTYLELSSCQFEVPPALVEVFKPKGLRVSIPDQEGIKLFAFHAKINEEMNGREGGTFSRDIVKAKNGRWTFYDPHAKLNQGDILYYWTYVDYFDGKNKLGYTNDDQQFVVRELLDKEIAVAPPVIQRQPETVTLPSGCERSPTVSNKNHKCSKEIIFNEDFNSLDQSFWTPEMKYAGSPDFEFVMYVNRPEILKTEDGSLKIHPMLTNDLFGERFVTEQRVRDFGPNCTGQAGTPDCVQKPDAFLILPPVTSAQISTKNKFSFKYGKVEIRAKLPKGDWIYPELFLNPVNEDYGPGYTSGQIRIAFVPGNENLGSTLRGGCILGDSQGGRNFGMKGITKTKGNWFDNYHKFTLIWLQDQITVAVDDNVYGNIFAPEGGFANEASNLELKDVERWRAGTRFAPFDKEMYLTLGVGVGGRCFEDRSDGIKPWKNNDPKAQKKFFKSLPKWKSTWNSDSGLDVDYIKIWAL